MRSLIVTAAAGLMLLSGTAAYADSPNWDDEKAAEVEQNRHSNSGLGNGGEKANGGSKPNEVGSNPGNPDVDPGNSGNQCQGGKNNANNGDAC